MVLQVVCGITRMGTDLDVLVSVGFSALEVQKKSQFQYNRDLLSDAKLLICQYGREHFTTVTYPTDRYTAQY